MTSEEIFLEALKSSELKEIFKIQQEDLENEDISKKSKHIAIEIIKAIIIGQENRRSKDQIFQTIQKQIVKI